MPKSLADGHTKFTILTEAPEDPENPTVTELLAGIDAECNILASDFTWTAGDSDKVAERALCEVNNSNALGAGNFTAGITVFRYFVAVTGVADVVADTVFAACKTKGTDLWCYARRTGKKSTEAWAATDESFLGGHVLTDSPQAPSDLGGYIKSRIPMEVQEAYENITVAGP